MEEINAIEKTLSTNDLGINGSHQGGMLIPKREELLSFFPPLKSTEINPRIVIYFIDEIGKKWKFNFIYYNNKFRDGTRNEYRLTGMTAFFRSGNLKVGDSIIFKCEDDEYSIKYRRQDSLKYTISDNVVRLVLNDEWRIIKI